MSIYSFDEKSTQSILDKNIIEEKDNLIKYLKEELKKKERMIDWLCNSLQLYCDNPRVHNCHVCKEHGCHNHNWRKAAEVAVTPNLDQQEIDKYINNI